RPRRSEASAFTPRLDQQRHQRPLRAAGVLELIDEQMVIARLEAVAALRKLLHLAKQRDRPNQQIRKVEPPMPIERLPVCGFSHAVHPENAARNEYVEVPFVCGERLLDRRSMTDHEVAMCRPRLVRNELLSRERTLRPGIAFLCEEMFADAGVGRLERCRIDSAAHREGFMDLAKVTRQEQKRRLWRTRIEESREPLRHRVKNFQQLSDRSPRCKRHVEVTRARREESAQSGWRDQPVTQEGSKPVACASISE